LVAEAEEVDRRHRFKDVYLRDEQLLDLDEADERACRQRRAVFPHRVHGGVNLVENLLEP
jgi:Mn-dependent DtxR family transcriptional regulator